MAGYSTQPFQIFTNQAMGGTTVNSWGVSLNQTSFWSIQAVWTGTPVGNFKIQVSDDFVTQNTIPGQDPAANVVNWSDYTGSTEAAGGGTGNWTWTSSLAPYLWVRLVYVGASSTGTVNAHFYGKG